MKKFDEPLNSLFDFYKSVSGNIREHITAQLKSFEDDFTKTMSSLIAQKEVIETSMKNSPGKPYGVQDEILESYEIFQVQLDSFESDSKSTLTKLSGIIEAYDNTITKTRTSLQKILDSFKDNARSEVVVDIMPRPMQDMDMLRSLQLTRQQSRNQIRDNKESPSKKIHEEIKMDVEKPKKSVVQDMVTPMEELEVTQFADPGILSIFQKIREEHRQSSKPYIDPEFPNDLTSLAYDYSTFPKALDFIWKRIDGDMVPNITLFGQQLRPEHIKQGELGDCYYLTSLSALAEKPELIRRLFYPQELTKEGCYAVTLCDSGEWKTLVIDNTVPCRGAFGGPAFSRNSDNGQWVALLEKAYAKMFGSYQAIQRGTSLNAFRTLTGASTEYYDLRSEEIAGNLEIIWSYLNCMIQSGFLLTASSINEGLNQSVQNLADKGIIENHSYTVLDAREVDLGNGHSERLVKLRNPWGHKEWKGAWSNGSSNWTDYVRKQLNYYQTKSEGVFWINLKDFHRNYSDLVVCKCHPNYKYTYIKLRQKTQFPDNISMVKLTVKQKTNAYISVIQKEERHFNKKLDTTKYRYSPVRVWLGDFTTKDLRSCDFKADINTGAIDFETILDKGEYLLYIESFWNQNYCNDLVVSAYSSLNVDIQEVNDLKQSWRNVMDQFVYAYSEKQLNSKGRPHIDFKTYVYTNVGAPDIVKYTSTQLQGIIFFYYRNYSTDAYLRETISMSCNIPQAIVLCSPDHDDNQGNVTITVPPQSERIVIFKITKKESMQWKYTTAFSARRGRPF